MKKVYLLMFGLSLGLSSIAQKVVPSNNIGIGTKSPDNSAVLDIQSVDKGLLIPRLSLEQRNAINAPATGLMVYQTTNTTGFYFYDGSTWKPLSDTEAKSVSLDVQNWSKTGDAGTNPASNFLGTTDNQPLVFKVNNQISGYLYASSSNTSWGYQSSLGNTGNSNTSIGYSSLKSSNSGEANVGIGYRALMLNSTGYFNTAVGANALLNNTTGYNNVALGLNSLISNQSGWNNVGLGMQSLQNNTIGENNIGAGIYALYNNTSGSFNMAVGGSSLFNNTTGNNNMSLGANSMFSNTSGSFNSSIGSRSGFNNTSGSSNVFIGYESGFNELGSNKLYISNNNTPNPLLKGDFAANTLKVNSKTTGFLAIGDFDAVTPMPTPTGYRLIVQDGILSEKIKVALRTSSTDWADYVFEPEYKAKMMKLEDVEKFTLKNKHLPNVPSAEDMVKDGLDIGKTSKMFMEKIEELTLYMIEMNKEIKALKAENEALKKK